MKKIIILVLVVIIIGLSAGLFFTRRELVKARAQVANVSKQEQVIEFTQLFIDSVLGSKGAVDFETRLALENKVRALGDKDILSRWTAFTASKDNNEAEDRMVLLLRTLMSKI